MVSYHVQELEHIYTELEHIIYTHLRLDYNLYLDFQKAFDPVPHVHFGISGKILSIFKGFLSHLLQPIRVSSGVLQETVLGPILLLIFIARSYILDQIIGAVTTLGVHTCEDITLGLHIHYTERD